MRRDRRIYSMDDRDLLERSLSTRLDNARRAMQKRAKSEGFQCNVGNNALYRIYIKQKMICAVSGLNFRMEAPYCIAADRISPDKGYTESNVYLVLSGVFMLRGRGTWEDVQLICGAVANSRPVTGMLTANRAPRES